LNYEKKFKKDGQKLTFDYQFSKGTEEENSIIEEVILGDSGMLPVEQTLNDEIQKNQLLQADFVLPFGKDNLSQFEIGYRGTFNTFDTDFDFGILETNGNFTPDINFSNRLIYREFVHAAYTQLGTKKGKFSILGGLRMEASDIGITLLNTNEQSDKDYVDWFPSIFLGYEFSEKEQLTLSYSRRLRRPRSRFINPFPSRTSNTNLFQGNPDLDPTYTNAFDVGYLKRWEKITFSTSGYYNKSTGVFQFITQETGDFVTLDKYTPKRNWRLTWNLNLFQQNLRGDFSFVNFQNEMITQNFDANNFTWFSRFSAKLPLPWEIDFQTNTTYRGPSKNAQSTRKGILSTNLAFSKDIVKDKATLSLNVSDLFNSRKRRSITRTDNVLTNSVFQWRQRQVTLSFLYRFNQQQNQRNRRGGQRPGGGDDFEFEG